MMPLELPSDNCDGVAPRQQILVAPHDAAGWAGYFLTLFSLLLPGLSFVLIKLGWDIHEFSPLSILILLTALYIALYTAFICSWCLSRRFPVRGALSLFVSLLLLPQIVHMLFTYR